MFMNKKATVILWLSMLGLIIGVVTMLGLRAAYQPEERQAYIGQTQLAMLHADMKLAAEHLFVKEAAPLAASAAVFSLAQHGGFYEEPECGGDGVPVWVHFKSNKHCLPTPEAQYGKHFQDALRAYLKPLRDLPVEYAVETRPRQDGMLVVGKASALRTQPVTIKEKRMPVAHIGRNLSFATELAYDFSDYEILGKEVRMLVQGIRSCLPAQPISACVARWLKEINSGPFLKEKRLAVHFGDCHYPAEVEQDKLHSETSTRYLFCALKEDGRTFVAYDAEKGTVEERPLEYWFGIEFG